MILKSRKVAIYFGLAIIMMMMPILPATITASTTSELKETVSTDTNEGTASYVETAKYLVASNQDEDINLKQCLFYGKAVASTEAYVEVKASPEESAEIVGKLFEYNIADVLEQNNEWTKISSGNLIGYAKTSMLCFDEEAQAVAQLETSINASVITDNTSVYSNNMDNAEIINSLPAGAQVTPVEFIGDYIVVKAEDDTLEYIIKENVSIDYGFQNGLTIAEEQAKIAKAAADEAARVKAQEDAKAAEEARIQAEADAKAKQEALRQQVIQKTKAGTDFTYNPTMQVSDNDIWIMACIVDWESGWQSYEGKLAVANIILNRVRSPRYPNTVTGVVYAKNQFSGVCDASGNPSAKFAQRLASGPRTNECVQAVLQALSGVNNVSNYTAFITTGTANYSAYSDYMVIGDHCFY